MVFNKRYIGLLIATISFVFCNQVQLITMHKKSNGTLLRIVSSSIIDIENIAGWSGQENWFYLTINGTYLSPSAVEYIEFEPPIIDIEITENNESVQIGYLFERPIEDFEIFHSEASRVILVQVWESLNDSLRTEVQLSEGSNNNRVFLSLKKRPKDRPFMIHLFTLEISMDLKNILSGIITGTQPKMSLEMITPPIEILKMNQLITILKKTQNHWLLSENKRWK